MKKFWWVLLAVFLGTGFSSLAIGQHGAHEGVKPGSVSVKVMEGSGTVTAVDHQQHTVTIRGQDGKLITFNAKHVKNLDQVKVGDKVKAEYIEELAIFVRRADAPPSALEGQAVELAPKGKMPAGLVVDTIQITDKVQAIDHNKHTITLKGPDGKVKTFKVDKSVKDFNQIKTGDQVVVRVTEAWAVAVVKP